MESSVLQFLDEIDAWDRQERAKREGTGKAPPKRLPRITAIPLGIDREIVRVGRRLWQRSDSDGCPLIYYDRENNVLCHRCASKSGYTEPVVGADRHEEGLAFCDDCSAPILPNFWEVERNEDGNYYEAPGCVGYVNLSDPYQGDDGVRERTVKQVFVQERARRQGVAHELLHAVCMAADGDEERLYLRPAPSKGSRMSEASLRRWYRRNGFRPCRRRDLRGWMVREPNDWRRV